MSPLKSDKIKKKFKGDKRERRELQVIAGTCKHLLYGYSTIIKPRANEKKERKENNNKNEVRWHSRKRKWSHFSMSGETEIRNNSIFFPHI